MHLLFSCLLNEHLNFVSINTMVSSDASLDSHMLGNPTDFTHNSTGPTRVRDFRATLVLEHQLTRWTKTQDDNKDSGRWNTEIKLTFVLWKWTPISSLHLSTLLKKCLLVFGPPLMATYNTAALPSPTLSGLQQHWEESPSVSPSNLAPKAWLLKQFRVTYRNLESF